MDLLECIADERRRVADLIDLLTPEQLAHPSLCAGWTVQDVAGHLLMPLVTPLPKVFLSLLAHRMSFDRANDALSRAVARRPRAQLASGLREHATSPFKPPGIGFEAPLNDLLVHQQDMRRPLGLPAVLDPDRVRVCLDFTSARLPASSPVAGLRLEADDVDWCWGEGSLVTGPGEALLLLLNRRRAVVPDLSGPGVERLRTPPA